MTGGWSAARKRPVAVEYRGPFEEPRSVETLEGELEVGEEYLEEHGAYYLVCGVEGEVYPVARDIFEETYETHADSAGAEGWYHRGEPMVGVRVIELDGENDFIVSGYTPSGGLVAYRHSAPLPAGESLGDYCTGADEHVAVEGARR